jgi:hypothetical protein
VTLSDPIYAPAITPETDKHWATRRQFRDDLVERLAEGLREAEQEVESGPLEGVRVVSHAQWDLALSLVRWADLPPVSDHAAEVVTGASITVWAACPRCKIAGPITLFVDAELRVDTAGAELHLKAKSKARTHFCGQLTIPVGPPVEGQESFDLEDLVGERCDAIVRYDAELEADVFCRLTEGHEGDHDELAAEAEVLEEEAAAATPEEALTKTPEEAAADVVTKRAARRAARLADRVIPAETAADDLLPGENLGACPWPGCELASEHPGSHQTAADDRPDEEGPA